jgi:basic amino acid/polyamine antiporter, APA family
MKEYESTSVLRKLPVDHIEEVEEESHVGHLAKSLGLWQLTAIGVGGIIGVGIFPSLGWWLMATRTTPAWAPLC